MSSDGLAGYLVRRSLDVDADFGGGGIGDRR
jgi:hypothetical protein